jgi:hypothetical protein
MQTVELIGAALEILGGKMLRAWMTIVVSTGTVLS